MSENSYGRRIMGFMSVNSIAYTSGKGEITILYRPSKNVKDTTRPAFVPFNDSFTEQDTREVKQ